MIKERTTKKPDSYTLNIISNQFIRLLLIIFIISMLLLLLIKLSFSHTIFLKNGGKIECSEIIHQNKIINCLIENNKRSINSDLVQEITYSKNIASDKERQKKNKQIPTEENKKESLAGYEPEIKKLEFQYWQNKNQSTLNKLINAYIDEVNENYLNNNYEKALSYLLKLEELIPFDSLTKLKIAYCYYHLSDAFMAHYYAQESKRLNKTIPETYFLLGDIYYDQNNLFDAKNEWEEGIKLKNDSTYEKKLSLLIKELEFSKEQLKTSSNHFKIEFDKNSVDESAINTILNLLEQYYKELTITINYYPNEPIIIIIYADKDFKEFTNAPDWSFGLYDGKIRIPGKNIKINDKSSEIIKHELVHALIAKKTNFHAPSWLHEGLALYFQNVKVKNNIKFLELPSLNSFSQKLGDLDENSASLLYAKSLSFVNFLINQYGMWKIILFLNALSTGQNTEDAFKTAYLQELNEIEKQWQNYIIATK